MLSSTSSSELQAPAPRVGLRAVLVLLAIVFAMLIGFEAFARLVIERGSRVQRMVNQEYREAIHIRRSKVGRQELLVVGNSLVGHGLDFDKMKRLLPPEWEAHRFWIYNTSYEDWEFGLRRIFSEGSRPDVVAVMFAGLNWYAAGIRGDYSSQYLFRARDLGEVQSRLDLSDTVASSLWFAHYSKFFALRSEVRKVLLESVLPDLPRMNALFKPGMAKQLSDKEVFDVVTPRISSYRDIAARYGARLVVIVPPIARISEEHQTALRAAAEASGVPAVIPMSGADVLPREFEDDMHLNAQGSARFTRIMLQQLEPLLWTAGSTPTPPVPPR